MKIIEQLKSHFAFTRGEQFGILLLSLCILVVQLIKWNLKQPEEVFFELDSPEIKALLKEIDSLERKALESREPKLYPFNPNFISDYKGYLLGLSPESMDCFFQFREAGNWIRSAKEFQDVTGVSDAWLDSIAPYFKFPQTNFGRKIYPISSSKYKKPPSVKMDLNRATIPELIQVPGIGEVLGQRIVVFRDRLGGFSGEAQLYAVYGLKESTLNELKNYFEIKTPIPIKKQNINEASASDIATLPGITFELAVRIWEFVRSQNGIDSLEQLQKIDEITPQKIALIQLYLSANP